LVGGAERSLLRSRVANLPLVAPEGARRNISRIQIAKKNNATLRATKPKWTPPFPGWKPDPETEISKHKNIRKKAKLHKVFPDVLPEPFTPYLDLKVEYSPEVVVRKGHFLPPTKLQTTPRVSWPSDPTKRWTLIMTSPDDPELVPDDAEIAKPGWVVPSEEGRGKEVLHWLVTNIPGSDMSQGQVLCDYLPPMPKKHAGGHRYVFLLFEQLDGETQFDAFPEGALKEFVQRKNWNTFKAQERFGLRPKGLAFFKATWDTDVSAQYARLDLPEPAGPAPVNPFRPRKWLDPSKW
jgi:large subunit ribosomal protein L38